MGHPTSALDYDLPADAIAQSAIEPRDASRLLVSSTLEDRRFGELPELLQAGDLLVVNRTRVRRARLDTRRRDTGGSVEVLLLDGTSHPEWKVMVRPARRLRPGIELETRPDASGRRLVVEIVTAPDRGVAMARIEGDVEPIVEEIGVMPLPPYFHGTLTDDDRYQTVFADRVGSAAAPTAALHFTPALLERLDADGVRMATVELDVGLDTFRPVLVDDLADHAIHTERFSVPEDTAGAIAETRAAGCRVIAVGTTVVRTLESAAADGGLVRAMSGVSDLFITPGYRCRVIDAMVTNFHAPRTTLIGLVAAVLGTSWRTAYETALRRGYRFLSFGDAMFIDEVDPLARRLP